MGWWRGGGRGGGGRGGGGRIRRRSSVTQKCGDGVGIGSRAKVMVVVWWCGWCEWVEVGGGGWRGGDGCGCGAGERYVGEEEAGGVRLLQD